MNGPAAIDTTLARVSSARVDGFGLTVGRRPSAGDGWFRVEELLARDAAPAALIARIRGVQEVPADYIRAEWLFESFARAVADIGGACLVADRRLPDLEPANLLMTSAGGLIAGTALVSPQMTVLVTDPVPDSPGLDRVAHWHDLAEILREQFTALVELMAGWLVRHRLRQKKTLWPAAADRLAQSLLWSGRAFGEPDFARKLTAELLDRPGPLRIPLETTTDPRGNEHHLRTTCCLAYRAAGGGLCLGCPLNR